MTCEQCGWDCRSWKVRIPAYTVVGGVETRGDEFRRCVGCGGWFCEFCVEGHGCGDGIPFHIGTEEGDKAPWRAQCSVRGRQWGGCPPES